MKQKTKQQDKRTMAEASTASFLKEVDEHMRYEQMTALWKQYRVHFFVALALVFAGHAGWNYYTDHKEQTLLQQAEAFWQAATTEEIEKALPGLTELAQNSTTGYTLLANTILAETMLAQNNPQTAQQHLAAIHNNVKFPQVYRDLALLYEGQLLMATDETAALAIFKKLEDTQSAFTTTALEMQAYIAEGKKDSSTAINLYERILATADIPPTLQNRTSRRLTFLKQQLNVR